VERGLCHPWPWRRTFDSARVLTVASAREEMCGYQLAQKLAARLGIQSPQALRLFAGEAQSRHFEKFARDAAKHFVSWDSGGVHVTASFGTTVAGGKLPFIVIPPAASLQQECSARMQRSIPDDVEE
jgi:hypothetical protein